MIESSRIGDETAAMSEETQRSMLEQLQEEAQVDLEFDLENADRIAMRLPSCRERWCRKLVQMEVKRKAAEQKRKSKYRQLHEHYLTTYNLKVDRRDIDAYIESDAEYQKLESAEEYWKLCGKYVDGVLQSLDKATYNIGNAVKWHMFKQGA